MASYDNVTVGKSGGTTSLSFSHTCSSSADRAIYVVTNNRDAGAGDVTGVTYNSVSLTELTGSPWGFGNSDLRVFRLVAPATGANDVVVTLDGSRPIIAAAISFTGVDQTTPDGTPAADTTDLSVDVASVVSGSIVLGIGVVEDTSPPGPPAFSPTGTATVTERVDDEQGNQCLGVSTTEGASGTVTVSWTHSGGSTSDTAVGVEIFAAAAASGRGPLINGGLINNGLLNAGLIR